MRSSLRLSVGAAAILASCATVPPLPAPNAHHPASTEAAEATEPSRALLVDTELMPTSEVTSVKHHDGYGGQ